MLGASLEEAKGESGLIFVRLACLERSALENVFGIACMERLVMLYCGGSGLKDEGSPAGIGTLNPSM
jgi:hypothetical protein